MKIALHQMEPWLIEHQDARYNLSESGVRNVTLGELLEATGASAADLLPLSLRDNDTWGSRSLREAVAALYPGVDPEHVLVTTGTSEALLLYFLIRHRPGANVVVPVPAFQNLYEVPRYLGYEVRPLPLRASAGFRPDLERLAELVDRDTVAIVLNNPHNPTGILFSAAELARIRAIAAAHGAEILADEHYRFLGYEDGTLLPSLYAPSAGVVATGSMIKCFGCVGLRIGWLLGDAELLAACRDLKDYTTHTLCLANDFLATRVLQNWAALAARYRATVVQNVARFHEFVCRRDDIDWIPPRAGIVAFPFFRNPAMNTLDYARELVAATGISILPGEAFDMPGHFRVGLGIPCDEFSQALALWTQFREGHGRC